MPAQLNPLRLALALALAALAVAVAGSQQAKAISVPVLIDAVTVENGVAVITGTVDAALVEVNGQVVEVAENGTFVAAIDLSQNNVVLEVLKSSDETVSVLVPVDVLLANGGEGVLNDLVDAGISIDKPLDGFRVIDGEMPVVEGRVLDESNLESLDVNGVDVLSRLGEDGLFSIDLGSSRTSSTSPRETVTIVATDRRGVSQTSTFTTTNVKSAIATRAGTSVSAAGARGVVISKIAFDTRLLKSKKYVRVLVTVKDRRGYLIRGASLRLVALPGKHVANGAHRAGFTNRLGKAQFAYRLETSAFKGGLLTIATRAATPKSTATKKVALRLPAAVTR